MTKIYKVNSTQFNYMYGDQLHMPYSIAMLISYLKTKPEISKHLQFEKPFVFRDKVEQYIQKCKGTDILLCSCYVWNWEITNHLAKAVKEQNPNCLIVFGGPQVPDDTHETKFFDNHPYVDYAVHGEGEITLANLLDAYINKTKPIGGVDGISTRNYLKPRGERISDLDVIPSPYLSGLLMDLIEPIDGVKWICSWESNRGCPFSCTFCFGRNSLITLPNKIIRASSEEYNKTGENCSNISCNGSHKFSKSSKNVVYNGKKSCLKFTLSNGVVIETTPNHSMFKVHDDKIEEILASNLEVGNWLPIQIGQNSIKEYISLKSVNCNSKNSKKLLGKIPSILNEDIAWLTGLLIGDGTIRRNNTVKFIADPCIEQKIKKICKNEFGLEAKSHSLNNTKKVKHIYVSTLATKIFEFIGVDKQDKLKVPDLIFKSPLSVVRAFLDGLWAADGYWPKTDPTPYLSTISSKLAQDVATLIHWIGDIADIKEINQKKYKPNVTYNVQNIFRVRWYPNSSLNNDSGHGGPNIPSQIPLSFGLTPNISEVNKNFNGRKTGVVHRARLKKYNPNHVLLQNNLIYTKIISIKTTEPQDVYDIINQPEHKAYINGVVAHNCDWGSATYTKLRKFSEERLYKEIEWFADHQIPYIDCCDGNFGIFVERDLKIAQKIKEQVQLKNWSTKVRPSWAKNSSQKIIPIAREFRDGNFLGAVTLAVQSLDETTLELVKRANIKYDKFNTLVDDFKAENIATYTELILGLPGETLDSFKKGLEIVADTKISSTFIYNCGVLPNAPMNAPAYLKQHGIEYIRSPIMLAHSFINNRGTQEYENIIVGTKYCNNDMLKEIYMYGWMYLTFQSLGILEYVCDFYKIMFNVPRMSFYDAVLEFCKDKTKSKIFSKECDIVTQFRDDAYAGKGWDHTDTNLGEIIWPIEEASWLRITNEDKTSLKQEILDLTHYIDEKHEKIFELSAKQELIDFQLFMLTLKTDTPETLDPDNKKTFISKYNWKDFFLTKDTKQLHHKSPASYKRKIKVIESDPFVWNYKTIWYGRKGKNFMSKPEDLEVCLDV